MAAGSTFCRDGWSLGDRKFKRFQNDFVSILELFFFRELPEKDTLALGGNQSLFKGLKEKMGFNRISL